MNALRAIRYAAWALTAVIGLAAATLLLTPADRPGGQPAAGRIGGDMVLARATGGTLDTSTLRGSPYALFFGFTQCPDVCPQTLSDMTALMDELDKGPLGPQARQFKLLFVTVDPERDTPAVLADYLSSFDERTIGLVPSPEQLPGVARAFAAHYAKVPTSSGYTMNHTSAVYLFDREGRFSGTIDIKESQEAQRAKLERLLAR